jgi:hypothetical protein
MIAVIRATGKGSWSLKRDRERFFTRLHHLITFEVKYNVSVY